MFPIKQFEESIDDELDDEVFDRQDKSPEFFEVSYSNALSSHRNSLSSISELASDEEVARIMVRDQRVLNRTMSAEEFAVHDPRFDLFCQWLEAQQNKIPKIPGQFRQSNRQQFRSTETDTEYSSQSGDELFHDAEKEDSPPESVKEMLNTVLGPEEPSRVIPQIFLPINSESEEKIIDTEGKEEILSQKDKFESENILTDPVRLRRKLHSPKKGRAPHPPNSPVNLPIGQDEHKTMHKETVL